MLESCGFWRNISDSASPLLPESNHARVFTHKQRIVSQSERSIEEISSVNDREREDDSICVDPRDLGIPRRSPGVPSSSTGDTFRLAAKNCSDSFLCRSASHEEKMYTPISKPCQKRIAPPSVSSVCRLLPRFSLCTTRAHVKSHVEITSFRSPLVFPPRMPRMRDSLLLT